MPQISYSSELYKSHVAGPPRGLPEFPEPHSETFRSGLEAGGPLQRPPSPAPGPLGNLSTGGRNDGLPQSGHCSTSQEAMHSTSLCSCPFHVPHNITTNPKPQTLNPTCSTKTWPNSFSMIANFMPWLGSDRI